MQIDRGQLKGHQASIEHLRRKIGDFHSSENPAVPTCSQLLSGAESDWNWDEVKSILSLSPERLDGFLFKLHFKRDSLENPARAKVLEFLAAAYQVSRDIRYFNEFLWFYRDTRDDVSLWLVTLDNFFRNLGPDNCHTFRRCSRDEADAFMRSIQVRMRSVANLKMDTGLRIGLLGSPTLFPNVRRVLKYNGFPVCCYFLPYHSNKMIRVLLRNKLLFFLLRVAKGAMFSFRRIDLHYGAPEIEQILVKDQLDIGFHKLGFIIKSNIISAFRIGLLNDHWALLPYIRGRSSIEYSVLLGVPLATTSHLVTESVDTGDIVAVFPYTDLSERCRSISEIRKRIRRDREMRAIESVQMLAKSRAAIVKNEINHGQTFYSMHPALVQFIDTYILSRSLN